MSRRRRRTTIAPKSRRLPIDRPARGEDFQTFLRRHYGAHPAQVAFCEDPARYRAAIAGIGGGKTEIGCFEAIRFINRYPGAAGLVVGPTFRLLSRGPMRTMRKVISWWPDLPVVENKSAYTLTFPTLCDPDNGEPSVIFYGYAQDPDSLRGSETAFFWIDEAALCKEEVFLVCQGRIRQPGFPHRAWVTGTPKGQNWLYRTFLAGREDWAPERQRRYGFHTWPAHDNPLYKARPDDLAALEESYGKGTDFYNQELLALFVALAGLVFKDFDRDKHCVQVAPPRGELQRVIGAVDWGVTSPGCILVLGQTEAGRVYALEEAYERGLVTHGNPGNDWLTVAQGLQEKWGITKFYCDPEDANAILGWKQAGLPVEKADNKRLPGVRAVQALIAGDNLRVVEPDCPNLLSELGQYHWRETADGKPLEDQDPAKEFDHAVDPLRYGAMALSNIRPARARRSYQG
jgi:PBSX family phage terminase large subunit